MSRRKRTIENTKERVVVGARNTYARLLNLCHDVRREGVLGIELHDEALDLNDVLRPLDEGQRDPVDPDAQHILQVHPVLGRQAADL